MDHAINNDIEEYGQPLQGQPWTALQAVSPNVPSLSFGLGPAVSPPQLKFESPDLGFLEYGRENQCSLLDFGGNDCLLPRSRHNESLVPLEYPAPLLNLESTPFEDNLPPYESDSGLLLRIESQSWGVTTPMDGKGHHAGAYFLDNMATQPATSAVATITLSDNGAAIISGVPPLYSSTTPIDTAQTACLPDSNHENHFAGHVLRTFERRSKRSQKRRWVDLDVVSGVSHANRNLLQQTGAVQTHVFRGVSRHRLTHRWEASLWLNGKQMYLGGFDSQEDAARAYDLAALACKGSDALINFHAAEYESQLREISGFSKEEVVAYVRRRSSAFSRGKSRYRGVSGHNNRWEARIGSFGGRKNVSLDGNVFEECTTHCSVSKSIIPLINSLGWLLLNLLMFRYLLAYLNQKKKQRDSTIEHLYSRKDATQRLISHYATTKMKSKSTFNI